MSEVEIKGHAIRTTIRVIGQLWGASIAHNVTQGITGEFADALRSNAIVIGGWYPIAWYQQLHELLATELPHEKDFPRAIGRATTEQDLSGIYRFILALTTPNLIARYFDKIVASYLRGGAMEVAVTDKTLTVQGQGWGGMSPSLWREAASGIELIFAHTGAREVTTLFRGVPGESLQAEVHWK